MKYEPIVIEHKPSYECPICHYVWDDKESAENCIQKHGDIPEFVKMIRHDIIAMNLFGNKCFDPNVPYRIICELVTGSSWKDRKNVDELEDRLSIYQSDLRKKEELIDKILDKIHQYRYCGS